MNLNPLSVFNGNFSQTVQSLFPPSSWLGGARKPPCCFSNIQAQLQAPPLSQAFSAGFAQNENGSLSRLGDSLGQMLDRVVAGLMQNIVGPLMGMVQRAGISLGNQAAPNFNSGDLMTMEKPANEYKAENSKSWLDGLLSNGGKILKTVSKVWSMVGGFFSLF